MKKKFAGILCAALALTIPFTAAACGGKSNGGDEWWSTTGELEKNGDEIVFNDVGLRLASIVAGDDKGALNQIVAQFNAEYSGKIRISVTTVGWESFEDYVARAVKQGDKSAPDIVMGHQSSVKSFLDYKVIQPIDVVMEQTGFNFDLNAFSTDINQYAGAGTDHNFGVTADAQSMIVFYNKELLGRYSQTVPSTREELFTVCEAYARDTGNIPIAWDTGSDFFTEYIMNTAVLQNGGTLYKDDYRVDWYDNTAQRDVYKKALESVRSFITNSPKLAEVGGSDGTGLANFRTNKAMFYMTVPWYLDAVCQGYAAENGCTEEVARTEKLGATSIAGWFAMDSSKDYAGKIYCDSHMFNLSNKVTDITQKAACLEFMKWFTTNADAGVQWARAGHVSISNAINAQDAYKNDAVVANYIKKWYPNIDDLNTVGVNPYYQELAKNLRAIMSEGLLKTNNSGDEELIRTKQNEYNSNIALWGGEL